MAVFETWLKSDLKRPLTVRPLAGNFFSQDDGANLIGAEVTDGGEAAQLSGIVTGLVIRADGATVEVTGTLEGNRASILLPEAAYAIPGLACIAIKVGSTTVGACTVNITRTSTDTAVDPGEILPSITTLIRMIEDATGSIPADYATLWATVAPSFDTGESYAAGTYVTHDGHMYRFITDHTAGSWNTAEVEEANVGEDLGLLDAAFTANNTPTPSTNVPHIFYLQRRDTDPRGYIIYNHVADYIGAAGLGMLQLPNQRYSTMFFYNTGLLTLAEGDAKGQLVIGKVTGASFNERSQPVFSTGTETITLFAVASTTETQAIIDEYEGVSA